MFSGMSESNIKLREMLSEDFSHMEEFLYLAIFVPPDQKPLEREIIFRPDIYVYIEGFNPENNRGDCGVLAEANGQVAGMAWTRLMKGHGHIDDETPELSMSVLESYRGKGLGTALMMRMFDLLKERGFSQTSLSVQAANPASRLYLRMGYEIYESIQGNVEVWTMIKKL